MKRIFFFLIFLISLFIFSSFKVTAISAQTCCTDTQNSGDLCNIRTATDIVVGSCQTSNDPLVSCPKNLVCQTSSQPPPPPPPSPPPSTCAGAKDCAVTCTNEESFTDSCPAGGAFATCDQWRQEACKDKGGIKNDTAGPGGTFTCSCRKNTTQPQHECQVATGFPINCTGGAVPNRSACTTSPLGRSPCGIENQSSYFCTMNCVAAGGNKKQCSTCQNTSECEAGLECQFSRCIKPKASLGLGGSCCSAWECGTYKHPTSGDVGMICLKTSGQADTELGICSAPDNIPPPKFEGWCTTKNGETGYDSAIGCIPIGQIIRTSAFFLAWAIGIGGGIAIILIIYAGFIIITSSGDPKRLQAGQQLLTSAIGGLLVVIFTIFIVRSLGIQLLGIL